MLTFIIKSFLIYNFYCFKKLALARCHERNSIPRVFIYRTYTVLFRKDRATFVVKLIRHRRVAFKITRVFSVMSTNDTNN